MTVIDTQFNGRVVAGSLSTRAPAAAESTQPSSILLLCRFSALFAIKVVHPTQFGRWLRAPFAWAEQGAIDQAPEHRRDLRWAPMRGTRQGMYVVVETRLADLASTSTADDPVAAQALMVGLEACNALDTAS